MNGYSVFASRLSDAELFTQYREVTTNWTKYGSPATDLFYWSQAIHEEYNRRHPDTVKNRHKYAAQHKFMSEGRFKDD